MRERELNPCVVPRTIIADVDYISNLRKSSPIVRFLLDHSAVWDKCKQDALEKKKAACLTKQNGACLLSFHFISFIFPLGRHVVVDIRAQHYHSRGLERPL